MRILMCEPQHFGVEYVINPWMQGNVGAASAARALLQWQSLREILEEHADVQTIEPVEGLPDMCFAANGGFVFEDAFVPPVFSVPQRSPESNLYTSWAAANGFRIVQLPIDHAFEGEGDALWWPDIEPILWAGYGVRSSLESHRDLAELLNLEGVSLRLVDERFYHLDTCFVPLPEGRIVYFPAAFDDRSRTVIEAHTRPEDRIEVGDQDALNFACNAVRLGKSLITNAASDDLRAALDKWGYVVRTTPMDEFIKAGGAAKCLSLLLDQATPHSSAFGQRRPLISPISTEVVDLKGHLLDDGILTRALDAVTLAGGSFRLENFRAGERSDQISHARFAVSAPEKSTLDQITEQLQGYGVEIASETRSAQLISASQDGVAPEDFYCSTIYPTDIHFDGQWLPVGHQRMDAVIIVDNKGMPSAKCTLMRDLKKGDLVVCHADGVRVRLPDTRRVEREFAFMSSGVSSERRVESDIEELAWEMRRIRARKGRIVVVAGPVVIHTGAGPHLAKLIRGGYVQALLAGNGLAVHDIETNLFGTSLGVDLKRGLGVQGGHQHHLEPSIVFAKPARFRQRLARASSMKA